ncbi:hypothetical protein LCGC14_2660410, partial [marine sediment metagenome]
RILFSVDLFIDQSILKSVIKRQAFKFKLKPTPEQAQLMARFAGCRRYAWNLALEEQNRRKASDTEKMLWYEELTDLLPKWKKTKKHSFLKNAHSQILQQALKDLKLAIDGAFDPQQPLKQWPKWKKKHKSVESFRYPQGFDIDNRRVFLPKIGWVGFFKSRNIEGTPKNITVKQHGSDWFVSIQTKLVLRDENGKETKPPPHEKNTVVGLDMGVVRFLTYSDGKFEEPLDSFRKAEANLAKVQRELSRKQKFSNNWKKQKGKVNRAYKKIAYCRYDYLQKLSTVISKTHAIVCVENLDIDNMTESASGTVENPGKNVARKSGLNKSILDQGWGMFGGMLKYKSVWLGGQLIPVPPAWTSQTCPECEYCSEENRKTQAEFICQRCGYENNADHVGAINVERAGHARIVGGRTDLVSVWKQKPLLEPSAGPAGIPFL